MFFTLSAIIGSAILYGDFKKAQFQQIVMFLYGCAATFVGVFVIAWAPTPAVVDEEDSEDVGGASEPESPDQTRLGPGTIGRRRRATLVLPSGVNNARETPSVRRKHGAVSMGLSPAQVRLTSTIDGTLHLRLSKNIAPPIGTHPSNEP